MIDMIDKLYGLTTYIKYTNQTITAVGNLRFSKHNFVTGLPNGSEASAPVLMRVELDDDGLITRLEEYIDSRALDFAKAALAH